MKTLRKQWCEDFDIVLIDSRTGLSDTGGICTIRLPDIVVAMFTANHQSLYGVRDVIQLLSTLSDVGLQWDAIESAATAKPFLAPEPSSKNRRNGSNALRKHCRISMMAGCQPLSDLSKYWSDLRSPNRLLRIRREAGRC